MSMFVRYGRSAEIVGGLSPYVHFFSVYSGVMTLGKEYSNISLSSHHRDSNYDRKAVTTLTSAYG